jgi:hypothetical protein
MLDFRKRYLGNHLVSPISNRGLDLNKIDDEAASLFSGRHHNLAVI